MLPPLKGQPGVWGPLAALLLSWYALSGQQHAATAQQASTPGRQFALPPFINASCAAGWQEENCPRVLQGVGFSPLVDSMLLQCGPFSDSNATTVSLALVSHETGNGEQLPSSSPVGPAMLQYLAGVAGASAKLDMLTAAEPRAKLANDTGFMLYTAWALQPQQLGQLAWHGALEQLTLLAGSNPHLDWLDVHPAVRAWAACERNGYVGLPYELELPVLFLRKDLLAVAGVPEPQTWEDLLKVAQQLHGAPCNTASGDAASSCRLGGFCIAMSDSCANNGLLLTSIWASKAAALGPRAGLFFEPSTMRPMLGSPAMVDALALQRRLAALGPESGPPCGRARLAAAWQGCAAGVVSSAIARTWAAGEAAASVALRPLPGSTKVLSADGSAMEECTAASCPLASLQPAGSTGALVNRAPLMGRGPYAIAINARAPLAQRLIAWHAAVAALVPNASWSRLLDVRAFGTPLRVSQLQDSAAAERFVASSWTRAAVTDYLAAVSYVLEHPNTVPPLRVPGAEQILAALDRAADAAASSNATGEDLAQALVREVAALDLAAMQPAYLSSIGYHAGVWAYGHWDAVRASQRSSSGGGLGTGARVGIGIGVALAGAALLAVAGVLMAMFCRRERLRGLLTGSSSAPGFGPEVSLMVTDIQDSTVLWEALPAAVMDMSLNVHNNCVRQLLPKHRGYECHTEGDSFILAFFTATQASSFALEVQVALMDVNWPSALLEHPSAAEAFLTGLQPPRPTAPHPSRGLTHSLTLPVGRSRSAAATSGAPSAGGAGAPLAAASSTAPYDDDCGEGIERSSASRASHAGPATLRRLQGSVTSNGRPSPSPGSLAMMSTGAGGGSITAGSNFSMDRSTCTSPLHGSVAARRQAAAAGAAAPTMEVAGDGASEFQNDDLVSPGASNVSLGQRPTTRSASDTVPSPQLRMASAGQAAWYAQGLALSRNASGTASGTVSASASCAVNAEAANPPSGVCTVAAVTPQAPLGGDGAQDACGAGSFATSSRNAATAPLQQPFQLPSVSEGGRGGSSSGRQLSRFAAQPEAQPAWTMPRTSLSASAATPPVLPALDRGRVVVVPLDGRPPRSPRPPAPPPPLPPASASSPTKALPAAASRPVEAGVPEEQVGDRAPGPPAIVCTALAETFGSPVNAYESPTARGAAARAVAGGLRPSPLSPSQADAGDGDGGVDGDGDGYDTPLTLRARSDFPHQGCPARASLTAPLQTLDASEGCSSELQTPSEQHPSGRPSPEPALGPRPPPARQKSASSDGRMVMPATRAPSAPPQSNTAWLAALQGNGGIGPDGRAQGASSNAGPSPPLGMFGLANSIQRLSRQVSRSLSNAKPPTLSTVAGSAAGSPGLAGDGEISAAGQGRPRGSGPRVGRKRGAGSAAKPRSFAAALLEETLRAASSYALHAVGLSGGSLGAGMSPTPSHHTGTTGGGTPHPALSVASFLSPRRASGKSMTMELPPQAGSATAGNALAALAALPPGGRSGCHGPSGLRQSSSPDAACPAGGTPPRCPINEEEADETGHHSGDDVSESEPAASLRPSGAGGPQDATAHIGPLSNGTFGSQGYERSTTVPRGESEHSMSWTAAAAAGLSAASLKGAGGRLLRMATRSRKRLGTPAATTMGNTSEGSQLQPRMFRGLRVRIGIHSGLDPSLDVYWTKRSGRRAYSGQAMRQVKLISDAALGGMVLVSNTTLDLMQPLLHNERLPPGILVWHLGRFHLGEVCAGLQCDVYQVLCSALLPRQQVLQKQRLRTVAQLVPGLLTAPLGPVVIATAQVVGVEVLREWDLAVAEAALDMFRAVAAKVVEEHGGTLVELAGGSVVAAFMQPGAAVSCMLSLEDDLKVTVEWPEEVLQHELGEEISVMMPQPDGTLAMQLIHCGPRVRCAVEHFPDVRLELGVTHALQLYRNASSGKPWKNLQRMLGMAKMGQTLCSVAVQRSLLSSHAPLLDDVVLELNEQRSSLATVTGAPSATHALRRSALSEDRASMELEALRSRTPLPVPYGLVVQPMQERWRSSEPGVLSPAASGAPANAVPPSVGSLTLANATIGGYVPAAPSNLGPPAAASGRYVHGNSEPLHTLQVQVEEAEEGVDSLLLLRNVPAGWGEPSPVAAAAAAASGVLSEDASGNPSNSDASGHDSDTQQTHGSITANLPRPVRGGGGGAPSPLRPVSAQGGPGPDSASTPRAAAAMQSALSASGNSTKAPVPSSLLARRSAAAATANGTDTATLELHFPYLLLQQHLGQMHPPPAANGTSPHRAHGAPAPAPASEADRGSGQSMNNSIGLPQLAEMHSPQWRPSPLRLQGSSTKTLGSVASPAATGTTHMSTSHAERSSVTTTVPSPTNHHHHMIPPARRIQSDVPAAGAAAPGSQLAQHLANGGSVTTAAGAPGAAAGDSAYCVPRTWSLEPRGARATAAAAAAAAFAGPGTESGAGSHSQLENGNSPAGLGGRSGVPPLALTASGASSCRAGPGSARPPLATRPAGWRPPALSPASLCTPPGVEGARGLPRALSDVRRVTQPVANGGPGGPSYAAHGSQGPLSPPPSALLSAARQLTHTHSLGDRLLPHTRRMRPSAPGDTGRPAACGSAGSMAPHSTNPGGVIILSPSGGPRTPPPWAEGVASSSAASMMPAVRIASRRTATSSGWSGHEAMTSPQGSGVTGLGLGLPPGAASIALRTTDTRQLDLDELVMDLEGKAGGLMDGHTDGRTSRAFTRRGDAPDRNAVYTVKWRYQLSL